MNEKDDQWLYGDKEEPALDSEYIDTQLSMISKVISNTIRYFTSQEVKNNIETFEKFINEMGLDNNKLSPAIKDVIQNVIKFLTTDQLKRLISYIESKPDEDLEKAVKDFLGYNYRLMERSYNGFLEFMVTKMGNQTPTMPEKPINEENVNKQAGKKDSPQGE
jgi:hypothetical protein